MKNFELHIDDVERNERRINALCIKVVCVESDNVMNNVDGLYGEIMAEANK